MINTWAVFTLILQDDSYSLPQIDGPKVRMKRNPFISPRLYVYAPHCAAAKWRGESSRPIAYLLGFESTYPTSAVWWCPRPTHCQVATLFVRQPQWRHVPQQQHSTTETARTRREFACSLNCLSVAAVTDIKISREKGVGATGTYAWHDVTGNLFI